METKYEEPDLKKVVGIQLSILSPDEIRNRSVVEVTKHDTYEKDVPIAKGLFDSRLGVTDNNRVCRSCGQRNTDCPGHFGHIELATPVYNFQFVHYVIKILSCVCIRCSKLLISKDSPMVKNILNKTGKARFNELYSLCQKVKRCGEKNEEGCNCIQPSKYKLDGLNGITLKWDNLDMDDIDIQTMNTLDIEYVKSILEKITDDDSKFLGFSELWCRPEWLICTVFPVPPPSVRPSVKQDNSQRMDDDLTHKLSDIVKTNNNLKQKIEANARSDVIDDLRKILTYHIATIIDNDIPGLIPSAHRSGRVLKSIRQRLRGKDGRIRNNLMGKRVNFSARSVITPDPNLELDQLGVPFRIAMNQTFPEIVQDFNRERLTQCIRNGPDKWPGANSYVRHIDNIKITIHEVNKSDIELQNGDRSPSFNR